MRPTHRHLIVPFVASLALVAFGPLGAGSAGASTTAPTVVPPRQELVSLLRPHEAHVAPDARSPARGVLPARTPITDERTVVPVLARRGGWLRVRLPGRPNGRVGWISASATLRSVTAWRVVVSLSERRVHVYDDGHPIRSFSAVVGKPSTPTPTGEFFVEESVALPASSDAAPFALALSARSDVLRTFDGGPGQTALHGLSNIGGVPGTAASYGCVRLESAAMRWLVQRIGPGVPVTIRG